MYKKPIVKFLHDFLQVDFIFDFLLTSNLYLKCIYTQVMYLFVISCRSYEMEKFIVEMKISLWFPDK